MREENGPCLDGGPGFGAGEVAFAAHATAVELYTPVGVDHQEPSAGVLDRVTCPSSAKCDEKIGSDVFGVSDVAVARGGRRLSTSVARTKF